MNPGKTPSTASVDAANTPASIDANNNAAPAVLVCGTINIDTFVGLDEFPHPG